MAKASQMRLLVATGLLVILLPAGCTSPTPTTTSSQTSTPSSTPTATTSPTPTTAPIQTGPYGTLTVGLGDFGGEVLDPIKITGGSTTALSGPHSDHLIRLDGTKMVPGLAEKWELAADGLSWTFYIRHGVKFQNLTELTAKDVKFSLDRFASKDAANPSIRNTVDHVDIVDDYTVRVYTKGPQPYLPMYVTFFTPQYGIVMPKDYIDSNGLDYYKRHPVGAGSYKMVRYISGDTAQYEAFDQCWRGAPAFKNLSLILVPENTTRKAMLRTGALDVTATDIAGATELERAGFRTYTTATYTPGVMFNASHDPRAAGMPLADVRVRQALSLAINREEMGKTFFLGKLGPVMPAFLSENDLDVDVPYWRDYAAKLYAYDPEQAKKLLAEAGFASGLNIKLYAYSLSGGAYLPDMAPIIQGYWTKIGVNAQIFPVEWGAYSAMVLPRPQVAVIVGQASTFRYTDQPNAIGALIQGYTTGTHGLYYGGSEFDQINNNLLAAQSEVDPTKRQQLVAQVVKTVTDSFSAVQIGSIPDMGAVGPKVDSSLPKPITTLTVYLDYFKHRPQ